MTYIKIKTVSLLYFIIFSLFMFLFFRTYIVEKQNNVVNANIINTKQYIKKSIDFLINEKKQSYIKSSKIIFSDDKILKTLENNNKERFINLLKVFISD